MPSDNFEQKLRERLASAEISPKASVWESISRQMGKTPWWRTKQIALAAILVLLIGLTGLGYLIFYPKPHTPLADLPIVETSPFNSPDRLQLDTLDEGLSSDEAKRSKRDKGKTVQTQISSELSDLEPTKSSKKSRNPDFLQDQVVDKPAENNTNINHTKALDRATSVQERREDDGQGVLSDSHLPNRDANVSSYKHDNQAIISPVSHIPTVSIAGSTEELQSAPFTGKPAEFTTTQWSWRIFAAPSLPWYTSTSLRVNNEDLFVPNQMGTVNTSSFYDITYSRTGIEAGAEVAYHINDRWQVKMGLGVFRSGLHKLELLGHEGINFDEAGTDRFTEMNQGFSGDDKNNLESFRTFQLMIPLEASFTLNQGTGVWVVSGGLTLNRDLAGVQDLPEVSQTSENANVITRKLIDANPMHLNATLGISYQFYLKPGMFMYVGPSHSYGLTSIYETAAGKPIYLNRLGLRVGIGID